MARLGACEPVHALCYNPGRLVHKMKRSDHGSINTATSLRSPRLIQDEVRLLFVEHKLLLDEVHPLIREVHEYISQIAALVNARQSTDRLEPFRQRPRPPFKM